MQYSPTPQPSIHHSIPSRTSSCTLPLPPLVSPSGRLWPAYKTELAYSSQYAEPPCTKPTIMAQDLLPIKQRATLNPYNAYPVLTSGQCKDLMFLSLLYSYVPSLRSVWEACGRIEAVGVAGRWAERV
ncbi:hypothetical protein E2C01_102000 [Portunus trituberculatus]|uniref:Uncharacterized protein n=1 Tax=Portunus trituberculatus TaxID=210409 RepID=A0A5B7KHB2_PORTR|nr:hypothetical protein [Portunus trituberculatus]